MMKPEILKQKMESLLRRIDDPQFLDDLMIQLKDQVEKEKLQQVQAEFAKNAIKTGRSVTRKK
jgi:hypothetical protein